MGKVYLLRQTNSEAVKVNTKVTATSKFSASGGSKRFIAKLLASDTRSKMKPVFVKYNSASSPSSSRDKTDVYASKTAEVSIQNRAGLLGQRSKQR